MDIAAPVQLRGECHLLGRLRARFSERDVESAYRAWRAERSVPFARVGMLASIVGWAIFAVASVLIGPDLKHLALPVIAVVSVPMIAMVLASAYLDRWHLWVERAAALANAASGTAAILILWYGGRVDGGGHFADIGTGTAVVFVFYGCTILRLPPGLAAAAITPYVALQELFVVQAYAAEPSRAVAFTALLLVAVVSGLLLSVALERSWRNAFQQERLIDAQREVIDRERERAERLLHSILPRDVAHELKVRPGTLAEAHDDVTVLFADLSDFTPLAARLTPTEVVELLNEVFSRFDACCEALGVEKIKTIGDAYMAVAGVPQPRADHAEACAELALAMRTIVRDVGERRGLPLTFRVGMHCGPVIAGVIGTSKFAYDLWGDTVNTAARMESHGLPGEIQVTDELAQRLRASGYALRDRGIVEVKGKGPLRAWLLDGRTPDAVPAELTSASDADAR